VGKGGRIKGGEKGKGLRWTNGRVKDGEQVEGL
jgi:hypothetical protein